MHSADRAKNVVQFRGEVLALLDGTSPYAKEKVADFTGFVFPIADFGNLEFKKAVIFGRAKLTQNANFGRTKFTCKADFSRATFNRDADFVGAVFMDRAVFGQAMFTRHGRFLGATFIKDADFDGVKFMGNAEFGGASFCSEACFLWAEVTGNADFSHVRFRGGVSFVRATVGGNADLGQTTFTGSADFGRATFIRDASFDGATFTHKADFVGATFIQKADFHLATFMGEANFTHTTFTQSGVFQSARFTMAPNFHDATFGRDSLLEFHVSTYANVLDLAGAHLAQPSTVSFLRVNEGAPCGLRIRLLRCPTDGFTFEDVNWHNENGRLTLQDEIDLLGGTLGVTHELVADAYRRLVNNFEKTRAHELAEDCAIGEMEMRRRNPRKLILGRYEKVRSFFMKHRWARFLGEQVSVVNLYRVLSNYGCSYTRALGVLLGMLLMFALLYPAFGLRMAETERAVVQCAAAEAGSSEASVISWRCASAHPQRFWAMWGTFKAGLLMTTEVATFQRERTLLPISGGGKALTILVVIAIPGQGALLALALRRRLRR